MYNCMVGIYKITSPSGRVYIGQSVQIEIRWRNYKKINEYCIGPKIANSLKKYGPKKHIFEVVEECEISKLDDREVFYKIKYDSINKGLNCELYDNGGGPRSEETKLKIKMSKTGNCKHQKTILQYDLKNKFIQSFPSIVSAERKYGKGIKGVLYGKTKTAHNFIWRYENEPLSSDYKLNKHKSKQKVVIQYNLDGSIVREWESVSLIQIELGFPNSNISSCCLKKQKTAYGYKWSYK